MKYFRCYTFGLDARIFTRGSKLIDSFIHPFIHANISTFLSCKCFGWHQSQAFQKWLIPRGWQIFSKEGNSLGWQIFGHSLTAENLGHLQGDIFWVIRCSFVSGRCLFCDSESFHGDSSIPGNFSPEIRKSLWDVGKGVVVSHVPVEHVELVHLHQVQVVPQDWLSDVVPADIEQINWDRQPVNFCHLDDVLNVFRAF